ncbi:hypothetical protein A5634_12915 [Mycobacterium asiaticum]|uniref:non-specific serine/threonine protein kinase n=1 Tax=Mycobacterium asiaticum TaxID=1790 RepID=A0A1A3NGF8_MYCAS|nr:serine/threonine-protein kinase [Mycobacterium asiaticum]OBK20420.1 hypothetical protein A5634_12915 [Mycobacterium asiaticum]
MTGRLTLQPGEVFAGYTIERPLGEGGMGTVYRARDPELPRSVALKLLHRDLTANDYIRARFELEAAHAASLEHPNIVTVYRRGRANDQLWIAMQFIDSTDASEVLRHGPVNPAHAVHITTETAKALDHAHAAGVLHRDVKPANILLERSGPGRPGRVLLADFGIAKALAETAQMTQTGMLVASLQYASPEQFDNIKLDGRADVYSLGCTLFHLLTGQLPYPGSTLPQLWAGHVKAPIPKPSEVRPGVPPALDAVLACAMAKERDDRYSSCGAFAAAARAALYSPPSSTQPTVVDPEPPAPPQRRVVPPVDPAVVATVADRNQPQRLVSKTPAKSVNGSAVLARVGLILITALIGAAMFTCWRTASYNWKDYSGYWHYMSYDVWQPLGIRGNTHLYTPTKIVLGMVGAVGVMLLLTALRLRKARVKAAGRLACVGAVPLTFALLAFELAVHSGTAISTKKHLMEIVALLGAVLLLAGCWRGLTPSKRNMRLCMVSGLVVTAAAVGLSFVSSPHRSPPIPVLGQGFGGLIAGIALFAAGTIVAVRSGGSRTAK